MTNRRTLHKVLSVCAFVMYGMSQNYTHHARPMTTTRRPRPGSLALPNYDAPPAQHPAQSAIPPWKGGDRDAFEADLLRREKNAAFSALQQARAKAEELTGAVRSAAFDDWVRRCVVDAQTPSEWTQASTLYENYIAHARRFGENRAQRSQSVLALATQTQWGRMMATLFPKTRRSAGWFYPLKLRRGA